MIGERLTHYRIESRLGAGGMGVVYRAFDEQLQRTVALKVLPESLREDPQARSRLLREARAASALNHPNICTVYAIGEDRGWSFIAMEFIEGRTLRDAVPDGGLPVSTLLRYGAQIADAVACAHSRQILHRDLKCSNVMLTRDGRAKVLDFGLSMFLPAVIDGEGTMATVTETSPDSLPGTPQYLAPELLRGLPASRESDVWSLGVILFEMAAGELPFRGRTMPELCAAVLQDPPAPLPERISPGLAGIIRRCLEKEPEHRYRTADEVRAALEAVSLGGAPEFRADAVAPADEGPSGTPSRARGVFPFSPRRTGIIAALLSAAVVVSLGVVQGREWVGGVFRRGHREPPPVVAGGPNPDLATLPVTSDPAAAGVYADGEFRGFTPCSIEAPPGRLDIVIRARGYEADTTIRFMEPGANPALDRVLAPLTVGGSADLLRDSAWMAAAERAWTDVRDSYHRLFAGRYPFAATSEDAKLTDVEAFFGPAGDIWKFYSENLALEVTPEGKPRVPGVPIAPDFLSFLGQASRLRRAFFGQGSHPSFTFALRPMLPRSNGVSTVIREVRFESGGQALVWRMGPRTWQNFSWPGPSPENGALLRVTGSGGILENREAGDWGLFRLLDERNLSVEDDSNSVLRWWMGGGDDGVEVRFEVSMHLVERPLEAGFFTFTPPKRVFEGE